VVFTIDSIKLQVFIAVTIDSESLALDYFKHYIHLLHTKEVQFSFTA